MGDSAQELSFCHTWAQFQVSVRSEMCMYIWQHATCLQTQKIGTGQVHCWVHWLPQTVFWNFLPYIPSMVSVGRFPWSRVETLTKAQCNQLNE